MSFEGNSSIENDLYPRGALQFLVALRDVVNSLVGNAEPALIHKDVDRQVVFGHEAEELLSGLRNFICYVINLQSGRQDTFTGDSSNDVLANKAGNELSVGIPSTSWTGSPSNLDDNMNMEVDPPTFSLGIPQAEQTSNDSLIISEVIPGDIQDHSEPPQKRARILSLTVLPVLRQHVFNTLPIRLLQFEMCDSKLNISLLDRNALYRYLAPKIEAEFDRAKYVASAKKAASQYKLEPKVAALFVLRRYVRKVARYSILSHTWLPATSGEVTHNDWINNKFDTEQPGYQKLANFCRVSAEKHGISLGWMDTVCINKDSSTELDESIRSMYKWYQRSDICITYLMETTRLSEMHDDRWFTRGWTLQELIAPSSMKFYGANWEQLTSTTNDKYDPLIQEKIKKATTITGTELFFKITGDSSLNLPISRRMQWAAKRQVTRAEDTAYSLMGIFDVSISIAYGEGKQQAFLRLLKEILNSAKENVLDLLNWGGGLSTSSSSLLPTSPEAYSSRSTNSHLDLRPLIKPLTLTHLGMRIPILLMPASPSESSCMTPGDYYATVNIDLPKYSPFLDSLPLSYDLLNDSSVALEGALTKVAFGILNFSGNDTRIVIPQTCFAVALLYKGNFANVTAFGTLSRLHTSTPIVFRLMNKEAQDSSETHSYALDRNELERRKIRLMSAYL